MKTSLRDRMRLIADRAQEIHDKAVDSGRDLTQAEVEEIEHLYDQFNRIARHQRGRQNLLREAPNGFDGVNPVVAANQGRHRS